MKIADASLCFRCCFSNLQFSFFPVDDEGDDEDDNEDGDDDDDSDDE